jgi:putative protease
MPKKVKGKKKPKVRKAAAKKAAKKKVVPKKKKSVKKIAKKKIAKKKTVKKSAKKKVAAKTKSSPKKQILQKPTMVKPGPQPTGIPSVEEPAANEEALGAITHYYSHLAVAVVQMNKGTLKAGDTIHIKGHTTDFTQSVESMEFEHHHIEQASAGQSFGMKVKDHVREHDIVYLVK